MISVNDIIKELYSENLTPEEVEEIKDEIFVMDPIELFEVSDLFKEYVFSTLEDEVNNVVSNPFDYIIGSELRIHVDINDLKQRLFD